MSNARDSDVPDALWPSIKQEITGIQLLWEAVEQMCFQPHQHRGIALLVADTPLLFRLMQTAMMESLLMRMSRLMDKASTGKCHNLSLDRLRDSKPNVDADVCELREKWDASGLKLIRDKYLSHNDLVRASTEPHSLNIPLSDADVLAMQSLADGFLAFRHAANRKISGAAYVDRTLDLCVQREVDLLNRSLLVGDAFYELLPEHACLQEALAQIEHSGMKGV